MSADGLILDVQVEQADFRLHIVETVSPVGITAIFGPSGAGKTTLLRSIAGFKTPTSGHIELNGRTFFNAAQRIDLPPHKRPIGFLFQDARLFSRMTVEQNIAYAEARVRSEHDTYSKEDIIAACDISSLMERRPDTLSGGERQRVALARTLMSRPEILLLDEPLAALDRQRKLELVPLLADLPTALGIPTLYVSHDIDEVSRVADHVIMLDAGQVLSSGPIDETLAIHGLEAGRNPYENSSLLHGTIERHDLEFGLTHVRIGNYTLLLPISSNLVTGADVQLKISPKDLSISLKKPEKISIQNVLEGTVEALDQTDGATFCTLTINVDRQFIEARITRKSVTELGIGIGTSVFVLLKSASFLG